MPTREYTCSACDFQIRSETEDELVEFVQQHASDAHDMDVSRGDVRSGWHSV
jgi:predicted small metal-binding protein